VTASPQPLGGKGAHSYLTRGVDIDTLADAWRRRGERRRSERLERAERARRDARRAAAGLRTDFEVDEVWLFGSLTSEPRHDAFIAMIEELAARLK